jgi:hypothetical protein
MAFTLTNTTSGSLGPFGLSTQTSIANLGTYLVTNSLISDFQLDPNTLVNVLNGNLSITAGSAVFKGLQAQEYLNNVSSTGQSTMGSSTSVTIASDQTAIPITGSITITSGTNTVTQATASNLNAQVVGNVASGSADSGNGVKVSTVYNSSLSALSSGQRADSQSNQFGELSIQYRNKYKNLTGNATTTVKSGSGRFHGVIVGSNWTGGTVTIYDNTAGSGTVITVLTLGSPSGGLLSTTGSPGPLFMGPLGLEFSTGLTVVTAGSTSNNITILYQ